MPIQWKRWLYGWDRQPDQVLGVFGPVEASTVPVVDQPGEPPVPEFPLVGGRGRKRVARHHVLAGRVEFGPVRASTVPIVTHPGLEPPIDWDALERALERSLAAFPAARPVRVPAEAVLGPVDAATVPQRERIRAGVADGWAVVSASTVPIVEWGHEEDDIETLVAAGVL